MPRLSGYWNINFQRIPVALELATGLCVKHVSQTMYFKEMKNTQGMYWTEAHCKDFWRKNKTDTQQLHRTVLKTSSSAVTASSIIVVIVIIITRTCDLYVIVPNSVWSISFRNCKESHYEEQGGKHHIFLHAVWTSTIFNLILTTDRRHHKAILCHILYSKESVMNVLSAISSKS